MMQNRILIVEDDAGIANAVALNLRNVGYECAVFDDGREAADSLKKDHAYDLALLDIMLPGMDGFELFSYMHAKIAQGFFLLYCFLSLSLLCVRIQQPQMR